MNELEIFNQTDKDIPELETVKKVLEYAIKKEHLDHVIFLSLIHISEPTRPY